MFPPQVVLRFPYTFGMHFQFCSFDRRGPKKKIDASRFGYAREDICFYQSTCRACVCVAVEILTDGPHHGIQAIYVEHLHADNAW